MNILRPAIESKVLDTAIYNDVGGRFNYKDDASSDYPRVVFSRISGVPDNCFAKAGESVLMQFDLFSMVSAGVSEIETMETDLKALFDDCALTLTGRLLCEFTRTNIIGPMKEDVSALQDGTSMANHTVVEYEVVYQTA
jgi:hypothetical protein